MWENCSCIASLFWGKYNFALARNGFISEEGEGSGRMQFDVFTIKTFLMMSRAGICRASQKKNALDFKEATPACFPFPPNCAKKMRSGLVLLFVRSLFARAPRS